MQIKSLQDINNLKTMVRVMDSTYFTSTETRAMVGFNFEGNNPESGKTMSLYDRNKSDWFKFNKTDLQTLTPIEYRGRLVGRGDEVLCDRRWYEVSGYHWCNKEFMLETALEKDYSDCWNISVEEIQDIRPLYTPKPEEIITVRGSRYQLIQE